MTQAERLILVSESILLRKGADAGLAAQLEILVGYCEPEPEAPASPQYNRLLEIFRTALCDPQASPKGEPIAE